MSKQLSKLKTLIRGKSGGGSYIFTLVFIADLQDLVFWHFAVGGEVLDIGINGGNWSNGGSGGHGGGSFSIPDQLGVIVSFELSLCLGRLTFICTMSLFVASEAESFPNA